MKQTNFLINYAKAHHVRFVDELKEFIRFPSISAQPKYAKDVKKCANWLANHLKEIGVESVKVIPTGRHPIVYADWLNTPGRPTVLIYGHYDVQPVDPVREWRFPPFEAWVDGNKLYGRGASDDKGQMFVHVKALESYLSTSGKLPVNIKCLFDGEEEIGSPNLPPFIRQNRDMLSADAAVLSDMPIPAPDRPAITYSLRGALGVEVIVYGPKK